MAYGLPQYWQPPFDFIGDYIIDPATGQLIPNPEQEINDPAVYFQRMAQGSGYYAPVWPGNNRPIGEVRKAQIDPFYGHSRSFDTMSIISRANVRPTEVVGGYNMTDPETGGPLLDAQTLAVLERQGLRPAATHGIPTIINVVKLPPPELGYEIVTSRYNEETASWQETREVVNNSQFIIDAGLNFGVNFIYENPPGQDQGEAPAEEEPPALVNEPYPGDGTWSDEDPRIGPDEGIPIVDQHPPGLVEVSPGVWANPDTGEVWVQDPETGSFMLDPEQSWITDVPGQNWGRDTAIFGYPGEQRDYPDTDAPRQLLTDPAEGLHLDTMGYAAGAPQPGMNSLLERYLPLHERLRGKGRLGAVEPTQNPFLMGY